jgi:CRP-like cAMP-binding protein
MSSTESAVIEQESAFREIVQRLVAWGLPQDEVEYTLQGAISVRELNPRAQLFAQDTPVSAIYLLKSGGIVQERITLDKQGRRRIRLRRQARPDEWVGHYDLLYNQQYTTRARALDFSRLIAVDAAAVNRLLYRYPRFRQRIAPMEKIGRLRTIPFFGTLDLTVLSYLADVCKLEVIPAQAQIYAANMPTDRLYIVDQGQVILQRQDRDPIWLGNGMAFGFLDQQRRSINTALTPRGHSAQATVPTTVFVVARQDFVDLTGLNPERVGLSLLRAALDTLDKVTAFARYTPQQRAVLLGYMSHYHIPIAHLVMQQGEISDSLWVLMAGGRATLHALEGGQALQPTVVSGPNFFSELALRAEQPLNSTVQAEPNSQWLRLQTEDFHAFLRQHGPELLGELALSPVAEKVLGQSETRRRYAWLQKGENLVLFQRRHWLALLRKVLFALILFVLVGSAGLLLLSTGAAQPVWIFWLLTGTGLLALIQFTWGLLDYLNDYLLVTNQRLVRQEKVIFIAELRQAAFLEQIRNVDVSVAFWGNLLGYGALKVQTAASSGAIAFDFVPDPITLKRTILEQQNLRNQHYQASSKMVIQNLLEERFGLRLRLPSRVLPETEAPPSIAPSGVWERVRHSFDLGAHMELHEQDKVIWRKHWLILLAKIIGPLAILIAIILMVLGQRLLPDDLQAIVVPFDIVLAFVGLVLLAIIAWYVADWRNDTYEIDNKQIADVEKKPLFFSEQRRTALLGEIEHIEVRIPSPIHFLFNFGNVRLQTAANQGEFSFDWVPNPRGVSEEIRRRIEVYRHQQEATRARQRAQELPDWFEMYNRLGESSSLGGQ